MSTKPGVTSAPLGVDHLPGVAQVGSDRGDEPVGDRHVGFTGLGPGAVDHQATPYEQIEHVQAP